MSDISISIEELKELIAKKEKEEDEKKMRKKRKNCDFNWGELLVVLILLYPGIKSKQDVMDKKEDLKNNERLKLPGGVETIEKYYNDISIRNDKEIEKFISNFDTTTFNDFKKIILSGKSFKGFSELININKSYDKKLVKSDIYILYENGKIIGISVKDSKGATLTNYSIEKLFTNDMKISHNLKDDRIKILKGHFGEENYRYRKDQRDEANMLFYDKENEYFKNIHHIIEANKKQFIEVL